MSARPIIIDVEASGFGTGSYPIEVGFAVSKEHRYCSLIRPLTDWTHWDSKAEAVHHISREILLKHGKPVKQVAADLNRILNESTVYSDGWVVDKPWINRLFNAAGMVKSFFISPLERILTEAQMAIWHETKDDITAQLAVRRHRASEDAFVIQETFMQTLKKAGT